MYGGLWFDYIWTADRSYIGEGRVRMERSYSGRENRRHVFPAFRIRNARRRRPIGVPAGAKFQAAMVMVIIILIKFIGRISIFCVFSYIIIF